jgi:putative heme-binding domain-containing protein
MALLSDQDLIARLSSENGYQRDIAQRLLTERLLQGADSKTLVNQVTQALGLPASSEQGLSALGVLNGARQLSHELLLSLMKHGIPVVKTWAVRAAGDLSELPGAMADEIFRLRDDPSPQVRLQVAIAAAKQESIPTIPALTAVLAHSGDDPLASRVVWQNLHPLLETQTAAFVAEIERLESPKPGAVLELLPRAAERILSTPKPDTGAVAQMVTLLLQTDATEDAADRCLQLLTARIRSGEITGDALAEIRMQLKESLLSVMEHDPALASTLSALELATSLGIDTAAPMAIRIFAESADEGVKLRLLNALVTAGEGKTLSLAEKLLASAGTPDVQRQVVQTIGRLSTKEAAALLINQLPGLPSDVQPAAIEALTDREASAMALLELVRDRKIAASLINANQAQKMLSMNSKPLAQLVSSHWGVVRTDRDPARSEFISRMRNELRTSDGDPVAGRVVFKKVCGQCHKIYGEGADVGPDITRNGRASFEQLLSNVFDPSLVIGASYQGLTVVTKEGRVVSGLPIEDGPQRVVLKVQGDKQEIIARRDIDEVVPSKLSLMPEGLEKQIPPQEMHDLFAFITLDKPPEDPDARRLTGSRIVPGQSSSAVEFPGLIEQLLPGYSSAGSGEGGIAVSENYYGRPALQTHPVSRTEPCRLTTSTTLPPAGRIVLRLSVATHEKGDWQLKVEVNGELRHRSIVERSGGKVEWRDIEVDLSDFAGQPVTIGLINNADNRRNEFAYWNAAEIVGE